MKTGTQIAILVLAVVLAFGIGCWTGNYAAEVEAAPGYITVDGQRIPLVQGANIRITKTTPMPPAVARTISGRAKGGDYLSNSSKIAENLDLGAPELTGLNGMGGTGGTLAYAAVGFASRGPMVILGIGIVLILAGGICWYYWNKRFGIYLILAGALLICIAIAFEKYPWLAVAIPVVAIGGLVIWWYYSRKAGQEATTLKTVVKGVENAEPAPGPVKASITVVAANTGKTDTVKAVVTEVKKNNGPA